MKHVTVYHPNGNTNSKTLDETRSDLSQLQQFVNGYITMVPKSILLKEDVQIFVNEDGIPMGLRPNNNPDLIERIGNLKLCGPVVIAENWKLK